MQINNNDVNINKTISHRIQDIMRNNIITGKVRMGEKIDVNKISDNYMVSGTPVREALTRLAHSGILEFVSRAGFYVKIFNENEINDIFEFRTILETNALEYSIKYIEQTDLNILIQKENCRKKSLQGCFDKNIDEVILFNSNIHISIIDNCNNQYIKKSYSSIYESVMMLWSNIYNETEPGLFIEHIISHTDILKAIKRGELQESKNLLTDHINKMKFFIIDRVIKK